MPTLCPTWEFISDTHAIQLHCQNDGDDLIIGGFLSIYAGPNVPDRIVLVGIPINARVQGLAGVNPWSRISSSEQAETGSTSTNT